MKVYVSAYLVGPDLDANIMEESVHHSAAIVDVGGHLINNVMTAL